MEKNKAVKLGMIVCLCCGILGHLQAQEIDNNKVQQTAASSGIINNDPLIWLRPEALADFDNSTAINIWKDSSGANRHFTVSSLPGFGKSARPVVTQNAINGYAALKFDGGQLLTSDPAGLSLENGISIAVVGYTFSQNIDQTLVSLIAKNDNGKRYYELQACSEQIRGVARENSFSADAVKTYSGGPFAGLLEIEKSAMQVWVNGEGSTSRYKNIDLSPFVRIGLGARVRGQVEGYSAFFNGCIAEVIIYDKLLSDNERKKLFDYLMSKYEIKAHALGQITASDGYTLVDKATKHKDRIDVVLSSKPEKEVLVNIEPVMNAADIAFDKIQLRFDENNWDKIQSVYVWASDTGKVEGVKFSRVVFQAESTDTVFGRGYVGSVMVAINDSRGSSWEKAVNYRMEMEKVTFDFDYDKDSGPWMQVRGCPVFNENSEPSEIVVTMSQMLKVEQSDVYSGLYFMNSFDMGKTWARPVCPDPLQRQPYIGDGYNGWPLYQDDTGKKGLTAFSNVTPVWHKQTEKVLAIGTQMYYSYDNERTRTSKSAYSVYDPQTKQWSPYEPFDFPKEPDFKVGLVGCVQPYIMPDGYILIPVCVRYGDQERDSVAVMKYSFDGKKLKFIERGNIHSIDTSRGFNEPSIIFFEDKYYLTLRNDLDGYVAISTDGLNFTKPKPWCFDDGSSLGNYNTQQHWATGNGGLFLVYTRKGAYNDHITRNRAPLFIGQVDPDNVCVVRSTERIAVPEKGMLMGNFGVFDVNDDQTWIIVGGRINHGKMIEKLKDDPLANLEYNNIYLCRLIWK